MTTQKKTTIGGQAIIQRVAFGFRGRPVRHVLGRKPEGLAPCKAMAQLIGQQIDQQFRIAQGGVLPCTLRHTVQIIAQRGADR